MGQVSQSIPTTLGNDQDDLHTKDSLEATAFRRKTKVQTKIASKLRGLIPKRKAHNRPINQFSVRKAPSPRPQVNLQRILSQAGLQIFSNNPNLQIQVYKGNPFQIALPQPIGQTIVLPPGNWQVQHHWQPQPFFQQLPFPGVYRQPAPARFYQHSAQHQHVPHRAQPSPQRHSSRPLQNQQAHRTSKATPAHVYQDQAKCLKINQSRVYQRFHAPTETTGKLQQKATDARELSLAGKLPFSKAVAEKKSEDYTRLVSIVETHQKSSANPLPSEPDALKDDAKAQIDNIERGMAVIDEIFRSGKPYFSEAELKELGQLHFEMRAERALLVQVMDDPAAPPLNGAASWQTATELKRTGYPLDSRLLPEFNSHSDAKLTKAPEPFGAGKYHSVVRLQYEDSDSPVIFKAEDAYDTSTYENLVGKGKYLDKARPRFAARNLAAGKLQDRLGVKLLPEMTMGTHQGKLGLFMSEAKGVKPYDFDTKTAAPLPYDSREHPIVSANLQKNLTNAQWLDCLTGQEDRHPGNLFVDPATGDVTLIDNDQAFYPGLRSVDDPSPNHRIGNWAPPWPGKPEVIDRQLYDQLQAMTPEQLHNDLGHLLEKEEIEATASRLKDLQQHASRLEKEGKVIDNWATWQSPDPKKQFVSDYLRSHSKPQSYFTALDRLIPRETQPLQSAESMPDPTPQPARGERNVQSQ